MTSLRTVVKAIRTTEVEWAEYGRRAEAEGITRNRWINRALRDTIQLERVIEEVADKETQPQPAWTQRRERHQ